MNGERLLRQTERLLLRDGNLCHYCDEKMLYRETDTQQSVSREHVVPRSFGGPNSDDNMVLCHRECNNWRGNIPHYCGCDFCVGATLKHFTNKIFKDWFEEKKPRVFKKYGRWFVTIGPHMFAKDTFEEAHCTLFIRKYYV